MQELTHKVFHHSPCVSLNPHTLVFNIMHNTILPRALVLWKRLYQMVSVHGAKESINRVKLP